MDNLTVTFTVDLTTVEGREDARRLCSWLAKERYDCPDEKVAGYFNGILSDIEIALDERGSK